MNRLLTWLDVRRRILQETKRDNKLNTKGITTVNCFSDSVEIGITQTLDSAKSIVKQWFGNSYLEEESVIQLDMGNGKLSVEFIPLPNLETNSPQPLPLWNEFAYLPKIEPSQTNSLYLPTPYTKTQLLAFYSFKDSGGKTLNLVAYLLALLERSKQLNQPLNILVIDADLEAPGLTYWNKVHNPAVCFLDFLEVYQYSRLPLEQSISLFANELKTKLTCPIGKNLSHAQSNVYFLPACLNSQQLLDKQILPEHLVRGPHDAWGYSNAINLLGQELAINYVFIDLRAGLSNLSSPLLFDPRVQRFIITTLNQQSVCGTNLVLQQIGKVAPSPSFIQHKEYYDPWLLINMLKQDSVESTGYKDAVDIFYRSYNQLEDTKEVYDKRLNMVPAQFEEELLFINSWDEARLRLPTTRLMMNARKWAQTELITANNW